MILSLVKVPHRMCGGHLLLPSGPPHAPHIFSVHYAIGMRDSHLAPFFFIDYSPHSIFSFHLCVVQVFCTLMVHIFIVKGYRKMLNIFDLQLLIYINCNYKNLHTVHIINCQNIYSGFFFNYYSFYLVYIQSKLLQEQQLLTYDGTCSILF